jgi:phosphatidylserine/phosphatidylglycerophosphate/cardiolipin synthase-like enzyme
VYFTRPGEPRNAADDPARVLADYIGQTRTHLDVCAHELDHPLITDALLAAWRRGVRVRLVTETNYLDERGVQALRAADVPVVDDRRDGALMHNKFIVFDNTAVWTGSMNFTENCTDRNDNHGLYFADDRLAANYATKFAWMFDQRMFGGLPDRTARIPHPTVTLRDGTVVENYFSTHDRIADRLIERIGRTTGTVRVLAFSFTHDRMGDALIGRARAGVSIQGVFEKSQAASGYSEYHRLRTAGANVAVFLDANPRNMHHKVLILDGAITVAGSYNFSESADRQNDENIVIIHSRAVAQQFEAEFHRLFAAARAQP